jgi:membrane protease YdiL (CAAX protease family)
VALLAAVSFTASLLAVLSLPWWAARWQGEFAEPPPSVEGALGAFLGWQLLGWLVVPIVVAPLPDPERLLVAQFVLYALGLALLKPLVNLRLRVTWQLVALGVTGYWLCLPGALLAGWLTKLLGFAPQSVNPALKMVLDSQGWQIVAMGLLVAVAGPCFEELLFRGVVYRALRQPLGIRGAMLASALLFAVVHADPAMVLPLLTLGYIFAWLTERSGSLVPSMLAHSFWNGATFLLLTVSRGG